MADDTKDIHVIHFWAIWCGPSIQELPFFEKVSAAGLPEVRVTLVSFHSY
jgi:thiol-disulfide isomerase/thioredoxin